LSKPFFRADHVGSLLRPKALHEARAKFAKGEITREQLRAVEDTAIREAVRQQEDAGLPVVTDGEFRRAVWWGDFIFKIEGTALGGPDESAVATAISPQTAVAAPDESKIAASLAKHADTGPQARAQAWQEQQADAFVRGH